MTAKVMLIDDDVSLLNTLERNLCADFDIITADGGEVGLTRLELEGPFSVVMVDMRMPGMDGVQTIQSMRAKQENLVFIMLTGNQDSTTAIQAMNVGRVFRFLNKPCNIAEIKQAIQDAQAEFNSKANEKDVLLNTMRGSINMLTDLAAVHSQNLASASDIGEIFNSTLTAFNIQVRPEDRMLCRLLLVGVASLTEPDRTKLSSAAVNSIAFHDTFSKLCLASSQMVRHIPRFSLLSDVLEQTATAAEITSAADIVQQKASALRIAFYWCIMSNRGASIDTIIETLRNALPSISRDEWSMIEVVHMATR